MDESVGLLEEIPDGVTGTTHHDGSPVEGLAEPGPAELRRLYELLVLARRVDEQADALAKQGALAVYASARGQEAAQVASVAVLGRDDMMFPSYRETVAAVARGVAPSDVLALFAGDWHSGFGPDAGSMPLCTPIATQLVHAVGWGMGARRAGTDQVALAFVGDGGTSEGDFHEALNFAGVFAAPVVFLVQNNRYAISVPLSAQTAAPTLAHRGSGYGMPGLRCDGQDAVAVWQAVDWAVRRARAGAGPTLIEAMTYRIGPHTNNDDPGRYRDTAEGEPWRLRDPVQVLTAALEARGLLDDDLVERARSAAEQAAGEMRRSLFHEAATPDPMEVFAHVYVDPRGHFEDQREQLRAELDAADDGEARP
jgi:2-oxoisovalerate dehydrogenase E1 component alpha subunit